MIDIDDPTTGWKESEKSSNKKTKALLWVALAILIAGTIFTGWLFLAPYKEFVLAEGARQRFKNFEVKIDRVSESSCVETAGFVCQEWQKEPGVQLQFRDLKTYEIHYEYLGLNSRNQAEGGGLVVQLLSVDPGAKTVKLKLIKK